MSSETALYTRVSTDDQNLARQKEETWNYAVNQLGIVPAEISVYQDKGTGRDTLRDDYQEHQELMSHVRAGEVERVIVLEVSRLSRSMRDLATTVETIVDENDTGLHILDMNLALEPGDGDAVVVLEYPPTAEVMSVVLEQRLLTELPNNVSDVSVEVAETGELCAGY